MRDFNDASRREFLGSLATVGAGMLLPASVLAQRSTVPPARKGLIDVHHHIGPAPNTGQRGGGGSVNWSPAKAVEEMDRNGIATGIGYPGPVQSTPSDLDRGRRQARELNEYGTQIAGDYRGRFGLFAALPVADIDGSLKEIEYAVDALNADGFGIATSYGDMWLGDSKLRPIWTELNRRKAVVYVHPNDDRCCTPSTLTYEKQGISGPWLEWPVNTARTILSLMTNGITREFPGIRFIFSHGGGVMPLLIHRIAGFTDWDAVGPERLRALFPNGIEAEFRKLYFEGAQAYSPVNMDALMKLVPASHILFGTDYDRFPIAHSVKLFAALRLSSNVRRAIERDNAVTLLPRWA
ncbi:MAG TPA: amidohydrolase family protein [Terriglobia bacterium]|nr:amidohydrolase family protein [Terriglobia bacterium]